MSSSLGPIFGWDFRAMKTTVSLAKGFWTYGSVWLPLIVWTPWVGWACLRKFFFFFFLRPHQLEYKFYAVLALGCQWNQVSQNMYDTCQQALVGMVLRLGVFWNTSPQNKVALCHELDLCSTGKIWETIAIYSYIFVQQYKTLLVTWKVQIVLLPRRISLCFFDSNIIRIQQVTLPFRRLPCPRSWDLKWTRSQPFWAVCPRRRWPESGETALVLGSWGALGWSVFHYFPC